jgi:hypothetical protein
VQFNALSRAIKTTISNYPRRPKELVDELQRRTSKPNFRNKESNDMKRFKVIYKGYAHKTWIEMFKIVTAVSREDARIKADLWEGVIIDIYEI